MIKAAKLKEFKCLSCDSLACLPLEKELCGVTSDLRPWPRTGDFAVCSQCGHVQKIVDQYWRDDVSKIYRDYKMYFVSGGEEQRVFDAGLPMPRSMKLVENLIKTWPLPSEGSVLDFGCGNGAFLRNFSQLFSNWRLYGFELDSKFAVSLFEIRGFYDLYIASLEEIDDSFDLVTMLYVIEHLTNAKTILEQLRSRIKTDGALLVQTSSFEDNPFDLVVVDHCSHFSSSTLWSLISAAGFSVVGVPQQWISKEIGLICTPSASANSANSGGDFVRTQHSKLLTSLDWLEKVVRHAESVSLCNEVNIFGTSIAGTWLANCLGNRFCFFVDEDPSRVGKTHLGHPIRHPEQMKDKGSVYMAFPIEIARRFSERLYADYPNVDFILPPENYL